MANLQEQSGQVAEILKGTIYQINALETSQDFSMVKTRVVTNLQRTVNELITQAGGESSKGIHDFSKPLTSVLGISVKKEKDEEPVKYGVSPKDGNKGNTMVPPSTSFKTPEEIAADEIRAVVDKLYPDFLNIETDEIVDKHSDIEIRAVAKRAGLPVTQTHPKNADAKFVNQIKKAIKKQQEIEEAGQTDDGNDENE